MKKGELSRQKLVDKTAELLQRQGFHATGLAQIVAESGAPRGSLYFHFPGGKEELACAALEASGARWQELLGVVASSHEDAGEAIEAVCRVIAETMEATGFAQGCPLATVALEAAGSSDRVQETIAAHYDAWRGVVAARLEGRVSGAERRRVATLVLSAVEGAMLLAKVERSKRPLLDVGRTLRALVGALPDA